AFAASHLDGRAQHAGGDAVANEEHFGVVSFESFVARFETRGANVFRLELANVIFEIVGLEKDRTDEILARFFCAFDSPRLVGDQGFAIAEVKWLHHLADKAISQDDRRIAICIGKIKVEDGQVGHLLHGGGRENEIAIVAVASALDYSEIVALLRTDVAEARASADDVDDHARK